MRITHPHKLTARPRAVQHCQRMHMAQLTTIERHAFNALRTHRLRAESRLPQIEPEALHPVDLRRLHRRFPR
ncbi:hypothetical protein D3C84_943560 [compost metagenome]